MFLVSNSIFGLDPHFSQFYASPLTLNPALTGLSAGDVRLAAIYRTQWASIDPFISYGASADMSIWRDNDNNDFGGIGLSMVNDKTGALDYSGQRYMFSLSYHKSLNAKGDHYLALGFQGGVVQNSIDLSKAQTSSQWQDFVGYDEGLPIGENISNTAVTYPDFQAGLMWYKYLNGNNSLFAGGSVFHITEPNQSFITGATNKLSRRYVAHAGGRVGIFGKFNLTPSMIYMLQGVGKELNLGGSFEYDMSTSSEYKMVALGAWFRNKDAFILAGRIDYKNLNLGVSYDLNISDLNNVTNLRGGLEITLTYLFVKSSETQIDNLSTNPCPRL